MKYSKYIFKNITNLIFKKSIILKNLIVIQLCINIISIKKWILFQILKKKIKNKKKRNIQNIIIPFQTIIFSISIRFSFLK